MLTYRPRASFQATARLVFQYLTLIVYGCVFLLIWFSFLLSLPAYPIAQSLALIPFFLMIPWILWKFLADAWRDVVVGERLTSYVQTWNSLAIKIPGRAPTFIRRSDCVAYAPRTATLTLQSGAHVRLPGNLFTAPPVPMTRIRTLLQMCRTLSNRKKLREHSDNVHLPSETHVLVAWFPAIEDELVQTGFMSPQMSPSPSFASFSTFTSSARCR